MCPAGRYYITKQAFYEDKGDNAAGGEGEQPGQTQRAGHPPVGWAPGAQDGGGFGVGCGDGKAPERTHGQRGGTAQIGGKPGAGGEQDHFSSHGVNDPSTAQKGPQGHERGASPSGPGGSGEAGAVQCQGEGQDAQKLLPVLCPVEKGCEGGSRHLPPPVGPLTSGWKESGEKPPQCGAQREGEDQAPAYPEERGEPQMLCAQSQGGTGESCREGVAFTGGDTETPGGNRPDHGGRQSSCEGGEGKGAEVGDGKERTGYGVADGGGTRHAQQIAARRQEYRRMEGEVPAATGVAMALGASVQPFTRMTAPRGRRTGSSGIKTPPCQRVRRRGVKVCVAV